jgi:hypothetical protein
MTGTGITIAHYPLCSRSLVKTTELPGSVRWITSDRVCVPFFLAASGKTMLSGFPTSLWQRRSKEMARLQTNKLGKVPKKNIPCFEKTKHTTESRALKNN